MGKKPTKKPSKKKETIDELDEDLFTSDVDEEFPDLEPKEDDKDLGDLKEEEIESEKIYEKIEEIEEDYRKYMKLKLLKKRENDYELIIDGQTHGFCNIFIKYLLMVEGVDMAAYKSTTIDPAKVFIRVKNGYNVMDLISKSIDMLETEVVKMQKVFKKNF